MDYRNEELLTKLHNLRDSKADDDTVYSAIIKLTGPDSPVEIMELMRSIVNGRPHEETLVKALKTHYEETKKYSIPNITECHLKKCPKNSSEKERTLTGIRKPKRVRVELELEPQGKYYFSKEIMRERILDLGGYNERKVLRKVLENSDITGGQNRLLLPKTGSDIGFLKKEETKTLDLYKMTRDSKDNLMVKLLEPCSNNVCLCQLSLRKWSIGSGVTYCLTGGSIWTSMIKRNGLDAGDAAELWKFRRPEEELCFALVLIAKSERLGGDL